ncbi:MAG: hypothetical protein LWY06_16890 [Firmicutes bacterium]|nr:hypothetical protein [Bacillota bacterium]
MWIFSKYGFFSIVKKPYTGEEGNVHIRARLKNDIEKLKEITSLPNEIKTDEYADYPYRIIVGESELSKIMKVLEESIDYSNFKDTVHNLDHSPLGIKRNRAYMNVWAEMARLHQAELLENNGK